MLRHCLFFFPASHLSLSPLRPPKPQPPTPQQGHTSAVNDIAFSKTGALLVSASSDMSLKLWNLKTFAVVKTFVGHEHTVSGAAFTPDDQSVVSCSRDRTIRLWAVETGYCVKSLTGHDDWVRRVVVSPDGASLASCSNDQTARVWNLQAGAVTAVLDGHDHVVDCVAFSNAKTDAAIARTRRRAALRSGSGGGGSDKGAGESTGEEEAKGAAAGEDGGGGGGGVLAVAAAAGGSGGGGGGSRSAGGLYVVTGSRDKTVMVWEAASGACLMTFGDCENWVRGVRFHPSGAYVVAVSEDRSLRVFSLDQETQVRAVANAHAHFVTAVDVHPSLPMMITGGVDKAVKVWRCR